MPRLKTLLWAIVLEDNCRLCNVSDSPKSRNLQKYRPKGSNPQDYNSVDLECGDSKVWSSLGTLVLITSLFSSYLLSTTDSTCDLKVTSEFQNSLVFEVKGIFGIKKWEISHVFSRERKSSKTLHILIKAHTSRVNNANYPIAYHFS